jgi:hypothetical protein
MDTGTKLELLVAQALKKMACDHFRDTELDVLHAIDFVLTGVEGKPFPREIVLQVTSSKLRAKFWDFALKACEKYPDAFRVFLEVKVEDDEPAFKVALLRDAIRRLFSDSELAGFSLFKVDMDANNGLVGGLTLRPVLDRPDTGALRGELQDWITNPGRRVSEHGFIYTPAGEQYHVHWRGFPRHDHLAFVRAAATSEIESPGRARLNIAVTFSCDRSRPVRSWMCPEATDVTVVEVPISVGSVND